MKAREKLENKSKLKAERYPVFLLESRPQYKSLGFGYHRGEYYFGTKVFLEGRGFDAVVTSDKKIYINDFRWGRGKEPPEGKNEIKDQFGLRTKEGFYHEPLIGIFDNKAIDQFLNRDISNITLQNVFDKLVQLFKKYIYLEDETKYKVLALYRIAGFFMPVWEARARLFLHAEFGSAKSRLTNLLHHTGFNSINLGDWTPAFMQRIIQSTGGELCIDDFESLEEEKKCTTIRLIKVGYLKGFKAGKVADHTRIPETFDLFNSTILNNTLGLDCITADRCVTIRIPKVSKTTYDQEPNFKEPLYGELRRELYILGLSQAKLVAEVYSQIGSEKIHGRLLSIFKPELTIAKLLSEELFAEIEAWWFEEINQRDSTELADDWEFLAYEKIWQLLKDNPKIGYFQLQKEITGPLLDELFSYDERDVKRNKRKLESVVGRCLTRNPHFTSRCVNGRTEYKISKEKLIETLKAKRWLEAVENFRNEPEENKEEGTPLVVTEETIDDSVETNKEKKVKPNSTSSLSSTPSTSSTSSTNLENTQNNKVSSTNLSTKVGHVGLVGQERYVKTTNLIHQKCGCGTTSCVGWYRNKPVCQTCKQTLEANGEVVIC